MLPSFWRTRYLATAALLSLATLPARAQQPELPQQPTAPPVGQPAPARPAPALPPTGGPELTLGRSYRVETVQGTTFTGQLISMSLTDVEFDSPELGRLSLPRGQLRRATDLNPAQPGLRGRPGYDYIGNGTRLFNAPTGRGLRKGEGTVLSTYLFLVGGEYGITDNISIQATVSLVPGVPLSEQLFIISPRFSVPVAPKVSVGGGLLYANIPFDRSNSGGAGLVYGSATYGSADDNLTLGVGYGFASGDVGKTPVFQLGGQKRVSNRISLISENYIVADRQAGMGGLYGAKFHWSRVSLGVAAAYFYLYAHDEERWQSVYDPVTGTYINQTTTERVGGEFGTSYVIPVYVDFAYRFGKSR